MIEPITDRDITLRNGMLFNAAMGSAGQTVGHSYDNFELLKCDVCAGQDGTYHLMMLRSLANERTHIGTLEGTIYDAGPNW